MTGSPSQPVDGDLQQRTSPTGRPRPDQADLAPPTDGVERVVGLRAELAHAGAAVSVVSLIGDVDLASRHVLAVALDGAAVAAGVGGRVVLDLDRVSFMGACGLGLVLAAHATASGLGGAVILVLDGDAPAARAVSLLVGAGPDIHPTLTAALAAAAA